MPGRAYSRENSTATVCVDACRDGVLSGRFYSRLASEGRTFRCLTEFLQEMEQILDSADAPRSHSVSRNFGDGRLLPTAQTPMNMRTGEQATFLVRILFRQNATWQGSITWLEGKREQSFRSVLELIQMICSASGLKEVS